MKPERSSPCSQQPATSPYPRGHEFSPRLPYMGADKSLARPGRKQATATEDFEFHVSFL
jgi:hypothetical protein